MTNETNELRALLESNMTLRELLDQLNITADTLSTDNRLLNTVVIIAYSLIVFVSLGGNSFVFLLIVSDRRFRTTTDLLIASLALSDIVMTAINIPFNVARILMSHWPFGAFLCFLVPFIQVMCVYVSTFTITAIAMYRFVIMNRQTATAQSPALSPLWLTIIIVLIWLLSALLALPHSVFNKLVHIFTYEPIIRCRVVYPESELDIPLVLSIEAFLTQYLIPLSISGILYAKIGLIISRHERLNGDASGQRHQRSNVNRRRIVMLVLIVVAFAVCWLPLNLYHILADFGVLSKNFRIFLMCHWLAMSSVCYNPFIYCLLNHNFCKEAKQLFWNTFAVCSTDQTV